MRVRSHIVTTARRKAIDVVSRPSHLLLVGAACLCLIGPTPSAAWAEGPKAAPAETAVFLVEVTRLDHDEESTSSPSYGAENRGPVAIKFDAISTGLGEDDADQTDTFVIDVSNLSDSFAVQVTTKASTTTAHSTLSGVGNSHLDDQGFRVTFESLSDGLMTITVRSELTDHALSHVVFSMTDFLFD